MCTANSIAGTSKSGNTESNGNVLKIKRALVDRDLFECYTDGLTFDVILIADDGER